MYVQLSTIQAAASSVLFEGLLSSGNYPSSCTELLKALTISSSSTYRGHCQLKQLILYDTVPVVMPHGNESDLTDKVQCVDAELHQ